MIEASHKDEGKKVYEIGYILIPSVPTEKVEGVVAQLKDILSKKEAVIIAEETPELRGLAYDMTKKIGTVNHRFEKGYFGWIKFEMSVGEIESVKKAFELHPDMLRILLIITIKENTYLGKKLEIATITDVPMTETLPLAGIDEKKAVPMASPEEMDKSIDEMVKEA